MAGLEAPFAAQPPLTPKGPQVRSPWLGIEFWQNGTPLPLERGEDALTSILNPRAAPIEIRIPKSRKAATVQMNAWNTAVNFSRAQNRISLEAGLNLVGYRSVFGQGEGMAASREGYTEVILSEYGNHYLVDERLYSATDTHDGFRMEKFYTLPSRKTYAIEGWRDPVYLVFFINANGDGCIDPGELENVVLRLR